MNVKKTCLAFLTIGSLVISCGEKDKDPNSNPDPDKPSGSAAPVITSFAPAVGMPGGEVVIQGKNFKDNITQNTVIFKEMPYVGTILEATTTRLTIRVPADAPSGKLILKVGNLADTSDTDLTIDPELIAVTSFSPASGPIGTPVILTGINFSINTRVKFNGIECTITNRQSTSLTFTVPLNTSLTKHKIEVLSGPHTLQTQAEFTVTSNGPTARWEDKAVTLSTGNANLYMGGTSFVHNNKIYWGFTRLITTEAASSFVVLDPAQLSRGWIDMTTPPQDMAPQKLQRATSVSHNGRVFLGTGFADAASNKWWEYDPATNTSTAMTDYPHAVANTISFVLNDKIYVGFGGQNKNLYLFDPAGNGNLGSWHLKATGTFRELNSGNAMVVGNSVILGRALPDLNQPRNMLLKFTEPDQLTPIADMPQDLTSITTPSFTVGNKGYFVINKNVWEYTPDAAGGSWRLVLGDDQQPVITQVAVLTINGVKTAFGWTAAGHLYEFKF